MHSSGYLGLLAGAAALFALACGDGETTTAEDGGTSASSTSSSGAGTGGIAGTSSGSGAGGASSSGGATGSSGSGGQVSYSVPDPLGKVFVSHFLGAYDIHGYHTDDLSEVAGGPVQPGGPTGGVRGISKHDVVVAVRQDDSTMVVYDGSSMTPIAGSPYVTGNAPIDVAHDDVRDLLYVYCLGTLGDPSKSLLTVYDTSSVPWQQLGGSPFDIDVPAVTIDVDPVTGNVFGLSLASYWSVSVANGSVSHQSGSPGTVDHTGADLGLDPGRRRFYFGERIVGQPQKLHALDMDTLAPVGGSPIDIPGSSLGDLEVHPLTGDIFLVDYGDFELHSASAEPFALRNTCGTNGCSLPPTETGLALDHELDKLFIVHVPDLLNPDQGQGFMTAWDIADALNPLEITTGGTNGTRPKMSSYPIIATAM